MKIKMNVNRFTSMVFLGRYGYGIFIFLFMVFSIFTVAGVSAEEASFFSSHRLIRHSRRPNIRKEESFLKDVNALVENQKSNKNWKSSTNLSDKSHLNSSYNEKEEKNQRWGSLDYIDNFGTSKIPTKTAASTELHLFDRSNDVKRIRIVFKKSEKQEEVDENLVNIEDPRKSNKLTKLSRVRRGFENSIVDKSKDGKDAIKNAQRDERRKKVERSSSGKSYNEVAVSLEKLAKVTVNDGFKEMNETSIIPDGLRESRDEENRKASPDIQDIITGIVNILNGKGSKQGDSGRPRPTNIRINNRGPPKISDVPPLDFDSPPPYRPLPPPKRIPPPYPFDIPPSVPSIPLPPQPHKTLLSKLPSHPFIEGVPIPEVVVPGGSTKIPPINLLSDRVQPQYDTISVSEPINLGNISDVELSETSKTDVKKTTMTLVTQKSEIGSNSKELANSTKVVNNNGTATNALIHKSDFKTKPPVQKLNLGNSSTSSNIKNFNKRVKPDSTSAKPNEKQQETKTSSSSSLQGGADQTTEVSDLNDVTHTLSGSSNIQKEGTLKPNPINEKPFKGRPGVQNKTETKFVSNDFLEPFANTTSINKPSKEDLKNGRNETDDTSVRNDTTRISTGKPIHFATPTETEFALDFDLPILLEPTIGFGEATPVLEPSMSELAQINTEKLHYSSTPTSVLSSQVQVQQSVTAESTKNNFKVRPGIVLDDPEYKPGIHKRPVISTRPIVTAPPPNSYYDEIFDVTVHAVQGPGEESTMPGKPYIVPVVDIDEVHLQKPHAVKGDVSVITKPEEGQKFVSIDGKRTYINLFGEVSSTKITPTTSQATVLGTGYAIPHKENPFHQSAANRPTTASATPPRRLPFKRPSHPPVRIDTCIVGDDSTCDSAQNEMCKTEDEVSSCHCRPGYNRKKHRDTCRRVVSMLTSIRVDRLYDKKIKWQDSFRNPNSDDYQQLSYEASQAIESAMSMTPFSDDFINSRINSIYVAKNLENNEPAVYVNMTIQLEENFDTVRPAVKQDIQRHLLRVIQRRNNNLGNSAVWVNAPPGSVLALQDVDECSSTDLHDCHERATCLNTFGSFKCQCSSGTRDPWVGNVHKEGRFCEACSSDYCNGRGECKFERGQQVCHCSGSFYGSQCEIDGEVLGVAIGASVAAAIIIILTLICLCMWSRRWSKEQKSALSGGLGSPVFGYMATGPTVKTPSIGAPPYQVSIEDRIRWAQIADVMAKANHYTQPETTKKSARSAFGGYPTLPSHTLSMTGTLPLPATAPPVPLPRLTLSNKSMMGTYGAHSQLGSVHQSNHGIRSTVESSSSEEEDRVDLLGRNFNAPRPKSRISVTNQSGIYYDVEYDRSDVYSKQNTIPMNTYSHNSHQSRPYFR